MGLMCLLSMLGIADAAEQSNGLMTLDNGTVKIEVDRGMGASITWLSWKDHPQNMINIHDPGRLIQQSYYAGRRIDRTTEGQSTHWSPWRWNPIQGGGVGSWARVTRLQRLNDTTLFGETVPKLWDMPDEEAAALMQQWTGFELGMPNVIVVRNRILCQREGADAWGPAIRSPTSGDTWNFGPHGNAPSDDPEGGPCVHVAPVSHVRLGPKSTYEYRYWLVVGDEQRIAADLDALRAKYSAEGGTLTESSKPETDVPAGHKPNVIIIVTDDHGYADLGALRLLDDIRTPHLDKLAANGALMTHGYVTAPQCIPSRAGIVTARYQTRFGLEGNRYAPMDLNETTIAERMRDAGYATGFVGEWHTHAV